MTASIVPIEAFDCLIGILLETEHNECLLTFIWIEQIKARGNPLSKQNFQFFIVGSQFLTLYITLRTTAPSDGSIEPLIICLWVFKSKIPESIFLNTKILDVWEALKVTVPSSHIHKLHRIALMIKDDSKKWFREIEVMLSHILFVLFRQCYC